MAHQPEAEKNARGLRTAPRPNLSGQGLPYAVCWLGFQHPSGRAPGQVAEFRDRNRRKDGWFRREKWGDWLLLGEQEDPVRHQYRSCGKGPSQDQRTPAAPGQNVDRRP